MTPLERAVAAINNTARVENVSGDQFGVVGDGPLYVVTNPKDIARAVLRAIREPSEGMEEAAGNRDTIGYDPPPSAVWKAMIDAALSEGGEG